LDLCRIHEEDVFAPHELNHVIAAQHGGRSLLENLALACYEGNHFKGTNVASVDPETGEPGFLFHPRHDRWSDDSLLDGARVVPLTAKGRATAALLKFNIPAFLELREKLVL